MGKITINAEHGVVVTFEKFGKPFPPGNEPNKQFANVGYSFEVLNPNEKNIIVRVGNSTVCGGVFLKCVTTLYPLGDGEVTISFE